MSYAVNWRGTIGIVNPTRGTGSIEELTRILPEGIGVIVSYNNIRRGTIKEFNDAIGAYDEQVREFGNAPDKVDAIHPAGTPPFMLLGFAAERELVRKWERATNIPVFTSGMNQVRAMKALGIKRFVGIGYDFDDTDIVARYFKDAGLAPQAMLKLPGKWEDVGRMSSRVIYGLIKQAFLPHRKDAQGIYLQGSKLRVLDIVEMLEQDLGVPVVHPIAARSWEIQRRLTVRQPRQGFGRLLAEMPLD
jgi:maleate cis-trans isomerase